jgi:hypothetical protein
MKPILYTGNIVERGTVQSDGAAAGKPVTRVADGDIGLPWVDTTATGQRNVWVDSGSGLQQTADAWLIAKGHNLVGVPCQIQTAPTPTGPWTTRSAFTPSSAEAFRVSMPAITERLWYFVILSPNQIPTFTEWVLSKSLTLPSGPQEPSLVTGPMGNIQSYDSPAGYTWTRKKGAPRWEGTYLIRDLTLAQRGDLEAAFSATDEGVRPFFLEDADGILRWVYWLTDGGKLAFQAEGITRWRVTLQFREGL